VVGSHAYNPGNAANAADVKNELSIGAAAGTVDNQQMQSILTGLMTVTVIMRKIKSTLSLNKGTSYVLFLIFLLV
jgi:hypothetical protein